MTGLCQRGLQAPQSMHNVSRQHLTPSLVGLKHGAGAINTCVRRGIRVSCSDGPSTSGTYSDSDLGWPTNIQDRFILGKLLGSGAYGQCKLAVERQSGQEVSNALSTLFSCLESIRVYSGTLQLQLIFIVSFAFYCLIPSNISYFCVVQVAVKILPKLRKKLSKERTLKKICQEVEVTALLQGCGNVVDFHAVYEDDEYVYLVLELCTGGDLEGLLKVSGFCACHNAKLRCDQALNA